MSIVLMGWNSTNQNYDMFKRLLVMFGLMALVTCISSQMILTTWNFQSATRVAYDQLTSGKSPLDAVEKGCSKCEEDRCDGTVGYGGAPDEKGDVSLDAMIMDGKSRRSGAIANLRHVKEAISVARVVMEKTYHSMIVGNEASDFAIKMGFARSSLRTEESDRLHQNWLRGGRNPNYWRVNASDSVGHDTISQIAIDKDGNIACGSSTNGLTHKIPGRVGDSPIVGAGAICDNGVGAAIATGNGDIILRFAVGAKALMYMKLLGMHPKQAAKVVLEEMLEYYPNTFAAIVVSNHKGEFGGWAIGAFVNGFTYNVMTSQGLKVYNIHNQP
jgi:N4-(beta-N-acetylglucosaminyl)-L-asparaginase